MDINGTLPAWPNRKPFLPVNGHSTKGQSGANCGKELCDQQCCGGSNSKQTKPIQLVTISPMNAYQCWSRNKNITTSHVTLSWCAMNEIIVLSHRWFMTLLWQIIAQSCQIVSAYGHRSWQGTSGIPVDLDIEITVVSYFSTLKAHYISVPLHCTTVMRLWHDCDMGVFQLNVLLNLWDTLRGRNFSSNTKTLTPSFTYEIGRIDDICDLNRHPTSTSTYSLSPASSLSVTAPRFPASASGNPC